MEDKRLTVRQAMLRAYITFALAAAILGGWMVLVMIFEPRHAHTIVFWPGVALHRLMKLVAISFSGRAEFLSTLLFWWFAVWLVLRFWLSKSRWFSNGGGLVCPFCQHHFPLTWRRYWKNSLGRHVCPGCGRRSRLGAGLRLWILYPLFITIVPPALVIFTLAAYGIMFFRTSDENTILRLLESPGTMLIVIAALALFLPLDRAFDVRFLKLKKMPKDGENSPG